MTDQTITKTEVFIKFVDRIVTLNATRRSLRALEVEQDVSYEAEINSINNQINGIMDAADLLEFEGEHFLSFYQRTRRERRKALGFANN